MVVCMGKKITDICGCVHDPTGPIRQTRHPQLARFLLLRLLTNRRASQRHAPIQHARREHDQRVARALGGDPAQAQEDPEGAAAVWVGHGACYWRGGDG